MRSAERGLTTVFVCKHRRTTDDSCITDFEEQCGFTYIDVESDENCFFRTIELYYKLLHGNHAHTYQTICKTIHQYTTEHDMTSIEDNGVWNNKAGDIVPYVAAFVLGVRIHLYELKPGKRNPPIKKHITLKTIQEEGSKNISDVYILRTNRYKYGLLIPI
jgi:hypothetical protein